MQSRLVFLFMAFGLLFGQLPAITMPHPAPQSSWSIPAPTADEGTNLDLLGHLGGYSQAADIQGSYAYVGIGPEVAIIDVSTPDQPHRVGYVVLPDPVRAVYAEGRYVYAWTGKVWAIDVADPAQPAIVGDYLPPIAARYLLVEGQVAYVYGIHEGGVRMLDLRDPTAIGDLGVFAVTQFEWVEALAVRNGYAYWSNNRQRNEDNVRIWDVRNPSAPVAVGVLPVDNRPVEKIAVAGERLYISGGQAQFSNEKTSIYGLTRPEAPVLLGTAPKGFLGATTTTMFYSIRVDNPTNIYLDDYYEIGAIDVGDPATPKQFPTISKSYSSPSYALPFGAAVLTPGDDSLKVTDLSDPSIPAQIASLFMPHVDQFAIGNKHAYVRAGVIDVTQPAMPTGLSEYRFLESNFFTDEIAHTFVVSGTYVLGGNTECTRGRFSSCTHFLRATDVSDPSAPRSVSNVFVPGGTYRNDTHVAFALGGYAFVGVQGSVDVVDIKHPAQPRIVSSRNDWEPEVFLPGAGADQWVYGFRGHYGDGAIDIGLLDITDPTTMTVRSRYTFPPPADPLTDRFKKYVAEGRYVYVLRSEGTKNLLRIIDFGASPTPVEAGSYEYPGDATDLAVSQGMLYVIGDAGLRVIAASVPSRLTQVGEYFHTRGEHIAVEGDTVYVGGKDYGLSIFQFHAPEGTIQGSVTAGGRAPLPGTTITTSSGATTRTSDDGSYSFTGLPLDTYVLTPTLPGVTFTPVTRTVTLGITATRQDFAGLPPPVTAELTPEHATTLAYSLTGDVTTTITFGDGTVGMTTTVVVTPTIASNSGRLAWAGQAFELGAAPTVTWTHPFTVTLRYSDHDLAVITEETTLMPRMWRNAAWRGTTAQCDEAAPVRHDLPTNTITFQICRPGVYALFGRTNTTYLPMIGR